MRLNSDWQLILKDELDKEYFVELLSFIESEYKTKKIFPKQEDVFRAFNITAVDKVKVVVLGQDPYHGENQANGLAFSVYKGCVIPPSLRNIFKELEDDVGCAVPSYGDLTKWAEDGVLLINSVLSVVESKPNSHQNIGWEKFTDCVVRTMSIMFENIVFILWGNSSQKKASFIDENKHLVLRAPHPSPLSCYRGFFGSKPFSKTNLYLKAHNKKEIDWCINL
ncbi:uracil-DNA glycosylase [Sulfurimonas sp.]|uniref:uracil-DNA glycosylase n=1 Tax=Sulfurimonas sp. TaxID=2022749 RepID=UPI002638EB3F|nr:uracil-DNA glycosylase [Sulfurimonas sp.]MDD5157482.1 uracil-DNA glycosylase [Sulfurimonas sp.]